MPSLSGGGLCFENDPCPGGQECGEARRSHFRLRLAKAQWL
jgi:hypothetical protein